MGKNEFVATDGWFQRWRKWENIAFKRTHRQQKDADLPAAKRWIEEEWPTLIASYSPENVYNADETGLYYRAMPNHTYLFKNESTKGHKISKERITVLCCVSMTGQKRRLLVIGKNKNPRCFKGVTQLPTDYCANKAAWMTTIIFNDWLLKWDNELKHNILLLMDNCTAHILNVSLTHINVVFLPANTMSLIQPCDQGVIRTLKAYYRHEMCVRNLENIKEISANDLTKKTTLLEALHLLAMSWDRISSDTIKNCFAHGGFLENQKEKMQITNEAPEEMSKDIYEAWMSTNEALPVAATLTESEICKSVCEGEKTILDNDDTEENDEGYNEKPPTNAE